jgi:betaine-aldehyde dehydrogenase
VLNFADVEDAVEIANDTLYGLPRCLESRHRHPSQAARRINAGTVWVNTFLEGHAELPFGGYRESGIGRELGRFAVEDYTEHKTVHIHLGGRTGWWMPR